MILILLPSLMEISMMSFVNFYQFLRLALGRRIATAIFFVLQGNEIFNEN